LDELWSFVGSKANLCWVWLALCRRTRQVAAYTMGERSEQSARFVQETLPQDYTRAATRADQCKSYERVFGATIAGRRKRTHRSCAEKEGETNRIERFNGTLRARASRFVRRSYSFSKSEEAHAQAFHLFVVAHNLEIRRQHSL
jgi:insertion element IS1 protein InsB